MKKTLIFIILSICIYILASGLNVHFFEMKDREEAKQKKIMLYKLQDYLQDYKIKCKKFPVTDDLLVQLKNKNCLDHVDVEDLRKSKYLSDIVYESDSRAYKISVKINGKYFVVSSDD